MKLSLRWLGRYVALDDLDPERIRDDLTMSTAEIEAVEEFGAGLEDVVVGAVLATQRHPNADKLTVCEVDVGEGAPLRVVCGAPNVAAGMRVAVGRPGATLPGGVELEKTTIRGVESCGMLCSERELGLSDEHSGILALDPGAEVGRRLADALPVRDRVLEIDNKSINHRPDLWGHYGFARELAAIYGRPLRPLAAADLPERGRALEVAIEELRDCPRFCGVVLEGVRAASSPAWLRWLLRAAGMRPINLLVDLTNFVMGELGQPMHAFDLRRLDSGGVLVRRARSGETIRTIDDVERALTAEDLVVTSGGRPVAIAGVMGGAESAVADDTEAVFLESANFDPALVRRTSLRLALRTDASTRFEKALDPANAELGSRRFVALLRELAPGAEAAGPLRDPSGWRYEPRRIRLRRARLDLKLGAAVERARVRDILEKLEFGVRDEAEGWSVEVPSFRATKDVTIEDDLVEEVGRMFRYDNIPERPLVSVVEPPHREPELWLQRRMLRLAATEAGHHEVYNYSFVPDALIAAVGLDDAPHATLRDPVAPEASRVRRHVVPSVLACVGMNLRERAEVRLMELGKGYHPESRDRHGLPHEVLELGLVHSRREGSDPLPELRSRIEALLRRVARPCRFGDPGTALPWLHPGRAAEVMRAGGSVGYVAALHPSVCRSLELPATTAVASLDLRAVLRSGREPGRFRAIPRFPSQPVDVALLAEEGARVSAVETLLRSVQPDLVRDVVLFEVYRGPGLPAGRKSLNFTVTLGAEDRTLDASDEERYLAGVRSRAPEVGAVLRG